MPILFPVPARIAKGSKFRLTWITYDAFAAVTVTWSWDRPATTNGTAWRSPESLGAPLLVTDPDERGRRSTGSARPRRFWIDSG